MLRFRKLYLHMPTRALLRFHKLYQHMATRTAASCLALHWASEKKKFATIQFHLGRIIY